MQTHLFILVGVCMWGHSYFLRSRGSGGPLAWPQRAERGFKSQASVSKILADTSKKNPGFGFRHSRLGTTASCPSCAPLSSLFSL